MKLEFGDTELGNDLSGDFIEDLGGAHQRIIQQEPLPGANAPFTVARGNQSNQRSFTVSKQHGDLALAVYWFNEHPSELPDAGALRITQDDYVAEQADAVLVSVERVQLTGRSTVLRYSFTGGQLISGI